MRHSRAAELLLAAVWLTACGEDAALGPAVEDGEWLSGGATTNTVLLGPNAFAAPAANITEEHRTHFFSGNSFFNLAWVEAPASTEARDGLGPLFNARSCEACHARDGRGRPPLEDGEPFLGLLLRVGLSDRDEHGAALPDAVYGGQIQPFGVLGVPGEATPRVAWREVPGTFADGSPYTLLEPSYALDNLAWGDLDGDARLSARVAPVMVGMGLLEAIPESRLRELTDPDDVDGDNISGRLNRVWDPVRGDWAAGRFGWRAEQPTVAGQVAAAFANDIGITSPLAGAEPCTPLQADCVAARSGGTPEIDAERFDRVVRYTQLLAVPVRRDWDDATVLRGKQLFGELGCAGCHVPSHVTEIVPDLPEVSEQLIWPYTDLLLHDMGPGLADDFASYEASGSEWRTPPLWGIGLVPVVNGHTRFLHDGRARDLSEAILWHGGEAEPAREAYRTAPAGDRAALLRFLESL